LRQDSDCGSLDFNTPEQNHAVKKPFIPPQRLFYFAIDSLRRYYRGIMKYQDAEADLVIQPVKASKGGF